MKSSSYPPGPKGSLLLGNLPDIRREQMQFLLRCARDYGDFVPLRLGPKRAFLLSHPDFIEQVYVTKYRHFNRGLGANKNERFFGNGLITSEGEVWRRQRQQIQPAFGRDQVADCGAAMVTYTERRMASWQEGEARDIHREMMQLTLQIILYAILGCESDAFWEAYGSQISAAMDAVPEALLRRVDGPLLFLPDWFPARTNQRYRQAVRQLDALLYPLIRAYRARKPADLEGCGLLGQLAQIGRGGADALLADAEIRDQLITLLFAGHETSANALTWACHLLATHPQVQATLHAELQTVLAGRLSIASDRSRLPYTENVILETLRLYPPAWISGREAQQPTEVGAYSLPAGATILMSQWVVHRDPRYFADPEIFRPERWADGLAKRLPRGAYFPFGGGPHLCIGNHFAMMEAVLVLAAMAIRFRFEPDESRPAAIEPAITLRPKNGLFLRLRRPPDDGNRSENNSKRRLGAHG